VGDEDDRRRVTFRGRNSDCTVARTCSRASRSSPAVGSSSSSNFGFAASARAISDRTFSPLLSVSYF
jgi:hypothetical protein